MIFGSGSNRCFRSTASHERYITAPGPVIFQKLFFALRQILFLQRRDEWFHGRPLAILVSFRSGRMCYAARSHQGPEAGRESVAYRVSHSNFCGFRLARGSMAMFTIVGRVSPSASFRAEASSSGVVAK